MKYLLLITAMLLPMAHGKKIAITFDDAPREGTALFSGEKRTKKLIESLQAANVEDAWFFSTGKNVSSASRTRLIAYEKARFTIANHSYYHNSANKTELDIYLEDINKSDALLRQFTSYQPYFRFPYLHYGETEEKRDALQKHLAEKGLKNGYVTIDNYDWYMDALLQKAVREGKSVDYEKLKQLYISALFEAITFYDDLAIETLGRSPKHVLLLHENDIAALFVGDLVNHLREKGWNIISPKIAYQDEIANRKIETLFNKQGKVAAIAHSQGVDKKLLRHSSENTAFFDQLFKNAKVFK